jgi:hypothetical protein
MTPKEKADELVSKMLKGLYDTDLAVQCALIAVDEILDLFLEESRHTRYWEDVIKEIKKL